MSFLLGSVGVSSALAADSVAVRIGAHSDLDACLTLGVVTGLNPNGDGFLAVRSGPDTHFKRIDKLSNGQYVYFCDQRNDWIGVVYTKAEGDCGVSSPVSKRQPYQGPCKAGWVHSKYVKAVAG